MELTGLDLRFPAVLSVGLLAALAATVAVHRLLSHRTARATSAVANSAALTALPEYRRALRAHRIRMAVLAASAVLLGGAALLGAARPVDTTVERPETRNRDIILCLDISGSMAAYDAELVSTFKRLVTSFEGERIGLVIFNSSAATVFPLTDDYDFINEELDLAGRALAGRGRPRVVLRRHLQRPRHLSHRRRPRHLCLQLRPRRHATSPIGRLRHRQPSRRPAPHRARRGR